MNDTISRTDAIKAMTDAIWHYPNECYQNLNDYGIAKELACAGLRSVPSAHSKQLQVLADVLDGCPLTQPCGKLWKPEGWCKEHCKPGQQEPDAECWLKYAEVMASEQ